MNIYLTRILQCVRVKKPQLFNRNVYLINLIILFNIKKIIYLKLDFEYIWNSANHLYQSFFFCVGDNSSLMRTYTYCVEKITIDISGDNLPIKKLLNESLPLITYGVKWRNPYSITWPDLLLSTQPFLDIFFAEFFFFHVIFFLCLSKKKSQKIIQYNASMVLYYSLTVWVIKLLSLRGSSKHKKKSACIWL